MEGDVGAGGVKVDISFALPKFGVFVVEAGASGAAAAATAESGTA